MKKTLVSLFVAILFTGFSAAPVFAQQTYMYDDSYSYGYDNGMQYSDAGIDTTQYGGYDMMNQGTYYYYDDASYYSDVQNYPIAYVQQPQYYTQPTYYVVGGGSSMYPTPATAYTGASTLFGTPLCSYPGYGNVACGTDPRQPVYDAWTGTWY